MEAAPTEYIWQYNPVTGRVGGANQNYGERINILHSNRYLYNRMQDVQRVNNRLATEKGISGLTGGSYAHYVPTDYKTSEDNELFLCGGAVSALPGTDGVYKNSLQRLADIALEAEENRAKEETGLTTKKFVKQFPPVVYENPFSGSNFAFEFDPLYDPDGNDFSHPVLPARRSARDGITGGALSLTGYHPKLHGGAISLAGQNPILGKTSI
ncbi:pVIII [Skua adenovirus 1]|uniref:PVIII n=1 Tax=South Polar skua adenovirus 1 TaxID=2848087 RepID=G9B6L2_9ADEN|nr:pVIII [Skua adenovirus 1]ADP30828.1 pVIII [Skua adenovirus 1]